VKNKLSRQIKNAFQNNNIDLNLKDRKIRRNIFINEKQS